MNHLILTALFLLLAAALCWKYKIVPFGMMAQNAGEAPGMDVQRFLFPCALAADLTATVIIARWKCQSGMVPVSLRCCPVAAGFDFTTTDETYVLSLEDDTTKISTDNAAVTALNKTGPLQATFPKGQYIAKDSFVTITLTLGGTTPIVPKGSTIELCYLEGGL